MDFAERHLRERGWERGKGLGRRENGISEAIKVKVKCGTAGVGHHLGEQFTFHWWDHVFNKAAANITVDTKQDGVKVKKVTEEEAKEEEGSITNKKPRKAQLCKDLLYGRFIKAATLMPTSEEPLVKSESSDDSDSDGDEKLDLSSTTRLTDEELVRACGGRTGHKGARHGLTMSAKLIRLEAQEREFLAKYGQSGSGTHRAKETPAVEGTETEGKAKRKKKKKRASSDIGADCTGRETAGAGGRECRGGVEGVSERTGVAGKRRERSRGEPVAGERQSAPEQGPEGALKKRKRKRRNEEIAAAPRQNQSGQECGKRKKRSKGERCPLG